MRITRSGGTALYWYSVITVGTGCIPSFQVSGNGGRGREKNFEAAALKLVQHTIHPFVSKTRLRVSNETRHSTFPNARFQPFGVTSSLIWFSLTLTLSLSLYLSPPSLSLFLSLPLSLSLVFYLQNFISLYRDFLATKTFHGLHLSVMRAFQSPQSVFTLISQAQSSPETELIVVSVTFGFGCLSLSVRFNEE